MRKTNANYWRVGYWKIRDRAFALREENIRLRRRNLWMMLGTHAIAAVAGAVIAVTCFLIWS